MATTGAGVYTWTAGAGEADRAADAGEWAAVVGAKVLGVEDRGGLAFGVMT
ncbi:MAG: hypothetical protein ACLP8S_10480 [Solirubrobacteraceae bacterium]